jgi:hypothetical protein
LRKLLGRSLLLHAKQALNACGVYAGNQTAVGEVTLLLLGFLGQDVALERMFSLDFS